jgi:hypothetical protein
MASLTIADQPITDAGMKYVGRLKNLRTLALSDTKVTDLGLKRIE